MFKKIWIQLISIIVVFLLFCTSFIFAINDISINNATAQYVNNNQTLNNQTVSTIDEITPSETTQNIKDENPQVQQTLSTDVTENKVDTQNIDNNQSLSQNNNIQSNNTSSSINSSNSQNIDNNISGESSITGSSSSQSTPSQSTPNQSTPSQSTPSQSTPSQSTPSQSGPSEQNLNGNFVFVTSGYGHGVGMSQRGAQGYASKGGWNHEQILKHYYTGVTIGTHNIDPDLKVTIRGEQMSIKDAVARNTVSEMGNGWPNEALKAQAIACFNYIYARRNSNIDLPKNNFPNNASKKVIDEVWGKAIYYNGTLATETTYFASSPGYTNNSQDYWSSYIPYLQSVPSIYEPYHADNKNTKIISVREVKKILESKGISTEGDPSTWFKIESTNNAGYATRVKVGDTVLNGISIRVMLGLKSNYFNEIRLDR